MNQGINISEVINRPGVYFNPQTEVLVVVDDSPELDREIFNLEEFEGAEWVLISDELPLDEEQRDVLLQEFQTQYRANDTTANSVATDNGDLEATAEEELEDIGRG